MGNATSTEFTVIFNYAERQLPVAKANLAEADIPYEIVKQRWLSPSKSRAKVTFRTDSQANAKRLRKLIPVQPGMLFDCFLAEEWRSEEARLATGEFRKAALKLGYSKYSVDRVCWNMKQWNDPSIWKTISREELEAMPFFAEYKQSADLVMAVQKGKPNRKPSKDFNKVIKDKLYYLSEKSGIPKGYLYLVLDVSETTLRRWSYNPANVSPETSDRIFRKIAYMDLGQMHMEKVSEERLSYYGEFLSPTPAATDYMYKVYLPTNPILTSNFYPTLRDALCWIEERGSKTLVNYSDENVEAVLNGHRPNHVHVIGYSRIARDKSLEMPPGVLKWDEKLLKR